MKKQIKQTVLVLAGVGLGILIGSNNAVSKHVEANVPINTKTHVAYSNANIVKNKNGQNVQRIVNDKVEIEFIDSDDNFFDILITPKGDFNVGSEFENRVGENYSDFYITGISKSKAKEFYEKNDMKAKGIEWTWNK